MQESATWLFRRLTTRSMAQTTAPTGEPLPKAVLCGLLGLHNPIRQAAIGITSTNGAHAAATAAAAHVRPGCRCAQARWQRPPSRPHTHTGRAFR